MRTCQRGRDGEMVNHACVDAHKYNYTKWKLGIYKNGKKEILTVFA